MIRAVAHRLWDKAGDVRVLAAVFLVAGFLAFAWVNSIAQKANDTAEDAEQLARQNREIQRGLTALGIRGRRETCRFAHEEQRQDRERLVASDRQLRNPEFAGFFTATGLSIQRLHELNVVKFYVDEGNYLLPNYCVRERGRREAAPPDFRPPANLDELRREAHPRAYRSFEGQRKRERQGRSPPPESDSDAPGDTGSSRHSRPGVTARTTPTEIQPASPKTSDAPRGTSERQPLDPAPAPLGAPPSPETPAPPESPLPTLPVPTPTVPEDTPLP